jgi:putative flippase GtrA
MVIDQALIEKVFKFGVVGFSAFLIDFGSTYFFKEKAKLNKYIANTLAFVISASYNFTLNRMWTWHVQDDQVGIQAVKFAVVMISGLLISSGLIYIFTDRMKLNFYLSKLLAVSVVMVWSFTMNNFVTFKP